MPSRYEDREKVRTSLRSSGVGGDVCFLLGVVFAVLGVIGDAVNVTLGLEPMSWFLLAIVASLVGLAFYIGWAVAWYLQEKR